MSEEKNDNQIIPVDLERLQKLVEESPYTQKELANIVHISESAFSKWKVGDRKISRAQIVRLCSALYCNPGWLIGVDEKRTPNGYGCQFEIAGISSDLPPLVRSCLLTLLYTLSNPNDLDLVESSLDLFSKSVKNTLKTKQKKTRSKSKPRLPE